MNHPRIVKIIVFSAFAGAFFAFPISAKSAEPATITLDLQKQGPAVSPMLYGLMTEEINHSYDGGIYAELIQNRVFKDGAVNPAHWSVVKPRDSAAFFVLDQTEPLNEVLTTSLKLDSGNLQGERFGIANDGFWGIPVKAQTSYRASFYARADADAAGPFTVSLESKDGQVTYARAEVAELSGRWQRYAVTLTTAAQTPPTTDARLVISTTKPGVYWFNLVSLFPPTYQERPNGNRPDIMEMLAAMKPKFLRLPGGNFLEGDWISTRFQWKKTLGPLDQRAGHPGCWSYRASDGLGLLEFLEWCEDLKMEPLLAVYAGYSLRGEYVKPGPALQPFVEEALEEIEYVVGDASTKWGARRAQEGHPEPFPLHYVEIGNEDGFEIAGTYDGRFTQFYDAIKAKYPQMKVIATVGGKDWLGLRQPVKTRLPDLVDEHYYRNAWEMESDAQHYDNYNRTGPKIFVGEWATREGAPTTNLNAALADAAWMTGMERNSDVVAMSCYAPLFVNVNPGAMQWASDLIGYNALSSYGSPSYHAQKMFSQYLGDHVVPTTAGNIPTQTWQPTAPKDQPAPAPTQVPALFHVATRDARSGTIYLKIVNASGQEQSLHIRLQGAASVASEGVAVVLSSKNPTDTNTISDPEKIVPVTTPALGLAAQFSRTFAPYSITVLQIEAR